tara:strand:- start:153714 stop:154073 length:360 start_codon:yes stop_codon:yes gene_type:complete
MALFFDQDWFDAKLESVGLGRDDVAATLRITREEVDEIWKDQREISPGDVTMLARLLKTPADEVVTHAGIATPAPLAPAGSGQSPAVMAKLEEMDKRLQRMERAIADLQSMILATRSFD